MSNTRKGHFSVKNINGDTKQCVVTQEKSKAEVPSTPPIVAPILVPCVGMSLLVRPRVKRSQIKVYFTDSKVGTRLQNTSLSLNITVGCLPFKEGYH